MITTTRIHLGAQASLPATQDTFSPLWVSLAHDNYYENAPGSADIPACNSGHIFAIVGKLEREWDES
jgi:hypothetical protein